MKKQVQVEFQSTKVLGPNGEVIPGTLDDIIKSIKAVTDSHDFVENSLTYNRVLGPKVKGLLASACAVTIELVKRGPENNGIDKDAHNLLIAKTRSFGKKNGTVNKLLRELAEERAKAEKEAPVDPTKPLSDEEEAKLLSEPKPLDPNTHKTDVTTTDGGMFTFDKVNYKVTLHFNDGTVKEIDMVPKGSWRETALLWLVRAWNYVCEKTKKAGSAIGGFFSRLNPFKIKKDTPIPDDYDENGNPIFSTNPPIAKGEEKTVEPQTPPAETAVDAKAEDKKPDTGKVDTTKPNDSAVVATT